MWCGENAEIKIKAQMKIEAVQGLQFSGALVTSRRRSISILVSQAASVIKIVAKNQREKVIIFFLPKY